MTDKTIAQRYSHAAVVTDRSRGTRISLWLTPEEYCLLDDYARTADCSRTLVVRQLIRNLGKEKAAPL